MLVEVGRQIADAEQALVHAPVGRRGGGVEAAHPGFGAAALLGTRGRLAEQHEGRHASHVRGDRIAHALLGRLQRPPVPEPAPQLQALRDREPVPRIEPDRLVVGLQRVGQLASVFQRGGELVAQVGRHGGPRDRRLERGAASVGRLERSLDLRLEARISRLGRRECDRATGGIQRFQHAPLALQCVREVVPGGGVVAVGADRAPGDRFGFHELALCHQGAREVGGDVRVVRSAAKRLLQRLHRRGLLPGGVEHHREVGPRFGIAGIDVQRGTDALRRGSVLPGLVQYHPREMQRRDVPGLRLQDRLVAVERLAQLSLAVHGEGPLELGREFHGRCGDAKRRSVDDPCRRLAPGACLTGSSARAPERCPFPGVPGARRRRRGGHRGQGASPFRPAAGHFASIKRWFRSPSLLRAPFRALCRFCLIFQALSFPAVDPGKSTCRNTGRRTRRRLSSAARAWNDRKRNARLVQKAPRSCPHPTSSGSCAAPSRGWRSPS